MARNSTIVFLLLSLAPMTGCRLLAEIPDGPPTTCGDGHLDPGEVCDGADLDGQTCLSLGFRGGTLACAEDCTWNTGQCRQTNQCGDGFVGDGEVCDGADLDGQTCQSLGYHGGTLACTTDCTWDFVSCEAAGRCGDGILQTSAGETCDGADLNGQTCQGLGYHGGDLACAADCTRDLSSCVAAGRCGDGAIQAAHGETCDGLNVGGQSCTGMGYHGGTLACAADCSLNLAACVAAGRCGDGIVQTSAGETCDGTNLDDQTCGSLGYYGGTLSCATDCTLELTSCMAAGRCGDGVLQPSEGETCDETDLAGETCEGRGYYGGTLLCSADCLAFVETQCAGRCGDGVVQTTSGEVCDGANLAGQSCSNRAFYGGQLACLPSCDGFNEAACVAAGRCGDGLVQAAHGEVCDGANLGGNSCVTLGMYGTGLTCFSNCQGFNTSACAGRCGDGIIQTAYGEVCDGANLDGDSCTNRDFHGGQLLCAPNCQSFNQDNCLTVGRCGDGVVQEVFAEQCDGANLNSKTCALLNYNGGTLTCLSDCTFDLTGCEGSGTCGDGDVQEAYEQCDGSNLNEQTCQSLGYYWGTLSCNTATCMFRTSNCRDYCGDGNIQASYGEDCDGANLADQSCQSMGYYTGALTCDTDCLFDDSACAEYCGDGHVQASYGENCDGTNHHGEDCESLGHHPGVLSCSSGCRFVFSGCDGRCGDGLIQSTWEDCDGAELDGQTCGLLGHLFRGELHCDSECGHAGCLTIRGITTGEAHSCAVLSDGTGRCWGRNTYGRLGDGTGTDRNMPVMVSGLADAVGISAGAEHTCAVLGDGTAKCWGSNMRGMLGDGTTMDRYTPTTVSGLTDVASISAGDEHTCAVLGDGTARCWGRGQRGQLGDGSVNSMRPVPVAVVGLTGVTAISAGGEHTCALLLDGTVKCWGYNANGQLGDGTTLQRTAPVTVSGLSDAVGVSTGRHFSCAVRSDGTARCWGYNSTGQLGDGTTTQRTTPVTVSGLADAVELSAGGAHACARLSDGTGRCWGRNPSGQLGDGTMVMRTTPVAVSGLAEVSGIGAARGSNGGHSCALVEQGKNLRCWGSNSYGQLGDKTTSTRLTPARVVVSYLLEHEDFENLGESPPLPSGWSRNGSVWGCGTAGAGPSSCAQGSHCGGTNMSGDYINNMAWGSHCLVSKELLLDGLNGAELRFHSWMHADLGGDGGRLQVLVDGAWLNIDNSRLSLAYTHTLGGFPCWSLEQLSWVQYTVNLAEHVGKRIRVRFCFYSNSNNTTAPGWYIDEFKINAW